MASAWNENITKRTLSAGLAYGSHLCLSGDFFTSSINRYGEISQEDNCLVNASKDLPTA